MNWKQSCKCSGKSDLCNILGDLKSPSDFRKEFDHTWSLTRNENTTTHEQNCRHKLGTVQIIFLRLSSPNLWINCSTSDQCLYATKTMLYLSYLSFFWTEEPVDASNLARHKDGFEDILEERRHTSDFKYCIRTRTDLPSYKYCQPRTPEEIKEHVINSDRVKYRVEMVRKKTTFFFWNYEVFSALVTVYCGYHQHMHIWKR